MTETRYTTKYVSIHFDRCIDIWIQNPLDSGLNGVSQNFVIPKLANAYLFVISVELAKLSCL